MPTGGGILMGSSLKQGLGGVDLLLIRLIYKIVSKLHL